MECEQGLFVGTVLEVVADVRGQRVASEARDLVEAGEVVAAVVFLCCGIAQGAEAGFEVGEDVVVHAGSWRGFLRAQGRARWRRVFCFEEGRWCGE